MNFTYYMPTKVFAGRGIIQNRKEEFTDYGQKALIVTGRNSARKTGALADVIKAIGEMNKEYVVFDKIEENPCTQTVAEAARLGKEAGADFVIGIGGGSPLDAAKAIGMMIKNQEVTEETLFSSKKLESVPIVAVPTTAGTGSETTPYAILTDHKAQTKRNLGQTIFCKAAFLDASYTEHLPYTITVNTALDAMTHLVEGYLNTNSMFISEMLVEKGLELWGMCKEELLSGCLSFEIREKLMLSSAIAGMVIAHTGTSLPHGMGYPLTYFKGMAHGLANAVLFKAYLRSFKDQSRVNAIYHFMGCASKESFERLLDQLIHCDLCLSRDEISSWSQSMAANQGKLKNHPEKADCETIYNIYAQSFQIEN